MWRADLCRCKQSCLNFITQISKAFVNFVESQIEVSSDVFKEAPKRSNCTNMFAYIREKVSGVFGSGSFSGVGKWLTRVSGHEDIHFVTKRSSVKGFKVRPNRKRLQCPCFHLVAKVRDRIHFDLTSSDDAQIRANSSDSFFQTSVSCTERDTTKFFGIIHTAIILSPLWAELSGDGSVIVACYTKIPCR